MNLRMDGINKFIEEFSKIAKVNLDLVQFEKIKEPLQELSKKLQDAVENVSFDFLTEEMKKYIDETKANENLSQNEFEDKYDHEIEVCKKLGNSGWVVSEHSNPREIREWHELLMNGDEKEIITYFEGDNGCILWNIFRKMEKRYELSDRVYCVKAKDYFDKEDYMTSAMYLVALIEVRTNKLMKYPKGTRYSQKYSSEGFEEHLATEFEKNNSFFTKRFLFLEMYPSIIEFLKRLFVDGEYTFEKGLEPPYINRNWLLHGRSSRTIERFECIQLFNALSAIEFVFDIANRET